MVQTKATIVICTLNRGDALACLLDDLKRQTYKDYEVIISDEIGITNAMNSALKKATGDIIIRIDDDVSLDEHWLEEVIQTFRDNPYAGGVTGPTFVPPNVRGNRDLFTFDKLPQPLRWLYVNYFQEGNPYALAKMNRCGAFSLGSNYTVNITEVRECDYLESTNYSLRTDLVRELGGWDPKYDGVCEYFEQDMVYKIKKLGYKMYYNPKAKITHWLNPGGNFNARFDYISRLRNWLRFVRLHLYTPRNTIRLASYFLFMCAYYVYRTLRRKK